MAAGLAARVFLGAAEIHSAGVAARFSKGADRRAVKAMKDCYGVDISAHSPKDVRDLDLTDYDLVVALDRTIGEELGSRFAVPKGKLVQADMPDPFEDGTDDAYRRTADALLPLLRSVQQALESRK
jgi:protein-tyrosine-phosphatase